MVYANDQWVQLPVKDLYDTLMMAIAINAAKDMYEKGQQEIKDFLKAYGDFLTPIAADQDWYNQNVTGRLRDAVNALYAQGIDPLRNALGRAALSQIINNMPYEEMAKARMSAETAREYIKARGELMSKGLWNEDMERYTLGGKTLETWDTSKDGVWGRYAPMKALTMDDIIDPLVKDMDPIFDAELTALMNDGYNYSTVSRDRIRKVIDDNMPDLIGAGTAGGYYYNQALQAAEGDKDKAKEILKDWYADRASKRVQTKREADQYKLDAFRTRNDNWLDQQKSARDFHYDLMKSGVDTDGNLVIDQEERRDYAKRVQTAKESKGKSGSESVVYAYNPAVRHVKDKDLDIYVIPAAEANNAELYAADGTKLKVNYNDEARGQDLNFIASGPVVPGNAYSLVYNKSNGVKERRYESGYFVYGTIAYKDPNTKGGDGKPKTKYITDKNGNPRVYKMRVTYGLKNEKK